MPNHVHVLLYFPEMPKSLNIVIGNAKRFMAYEIIKRLEADKNFEYAKECYSNEFVFQKLEYIHKNPVSKKWQLVNDFTEYLHSSAAFYEKGVGSYNKILHVNEILL